jgi:hypothetical protein
VSAKPRPAGFNPDAPYWVMLREAEKRIIQGARDQAGSTDGAAALLGVSRSFYRRRCTILDLKFDTLGRPRTRDRSHAYPMRVPGPTRTRAMDPNLETETETEAEADDGGEA